MEFINLLLTSFIKAFTESSLKPIFKKLLERIVKSDKDTIGHQLKDSMLNDSSLKAIKSSIVKEKNFKKLTGISTNAKSIPKLKRLKNKLGENFTWEKISPSLEFINLRGKEAEVNFSKFEEIGLSAFILTFYYSVGTGVYLLIKLTSEGSQTSYFVTKLCISVLPFLLAVLISFLTKPMFTASSMKKSLRGR